MPEILDWQAAVDQRALVRRAAQALTDGQLVAFPTDTVYEIAACALAPGAVQRLSRLHNSAGPIPIAVPSAGHALDWVPEMTALGRRLARRCWPGPVTLVFAEGAEHGLARRLPDAVRPTVCPQGEIGLCVPGHDALWHTLRLLPAPVVLAGLHRNGDPLPASADQLAQMVGDEVLLVLDAGPSRDDRAASVVRIKGESWNVVHEGVVSAVELGQQTTCVIVFVCTGNTCRSPMAEALCTKILAEKLGCSVEELPQRGFLVLSAGVAAAEGDQAAPEAVEIVKEHGADLSGHSSRALSADVVAQADFLITMTRSHADAVRARFARQAPRPRLLCPAGGDVSDPIGGDREVYRHCAQQILAHLERLLPELQRS